MHNYFLSARCENAEKREKAKMQLDEKERIGLQRNGPTRWMVDYQVKVR